MKPFNEVGNGEQFRRLRPVAERALAAYDLGPARLSPVQQVSNAVYRVEAGDGRRYALRVHNARWSDPHAIEAELRWLEAVAGRGGGPVPAPMRTSAGDRVPSIAAPGIPEPRLCTLLTWVPGCRFGKRITRERIRRVGALIARLHLVSAGFAAPSGFVRPRLDAAGLMGRTADLAPGWQGLTPGQCELFERVGERLGRAAAQLGESPEHARFRDYAPRFMRIVGPKIAMCLQAAGG